MNAIMIICHKNIEQVVRLIYKCVSENTKIFVHIDAQFKLSQQQADDLNKTDVYICEKRIHGELDHRSLVDITMILINKAIEIENREDVRFQYYCLLSGQDYLTKPIWYINDQLKEHYPIPYIDCTPYNRRNWIYHKFSYTKKFLPFLQWTKKAAKRGSLLWLVLKGIAYTYEKVADVSHISNYYKLKVDCIDIYGGSAWWILPDVAIKHIVKEYNSDSQYINYLLDSWTPEETFFQTITMRSESAQYVHLNTPDTVTQSCKTWAYFFDDDKPPTVHPYIFTKNEYRKLIDHDCWFARKFDIGMDSDILDKLDEYLEEFKCD